MSDLGETRRRGRSTFQTARTVTIIIWSSTPRGRRTGDGGHLRDSSHPLPIPPFLLMGLVPQRPRTATSALLCTPACRSQGAGQYRASGNELSNSCTPFGRAIASGHASRCGSCCNILAMPWPCPCHAPAMPARATALISKSWGVAPSLPCPAARSATAGPRSSSLGLHLAG